MLTMATHTHRHATRTHRHTYNTYKQTYTEIHARANLFKNGRRQQSNCVESSWLVGFGFGSFSASFLALADPEGKEGKEPIGLIAL